MRRAAIAVVALTLGALAAQPPSALAAPEWNDGEPAISVLQNCLTGDFEYGAGAFVGQYVDRANLSRPGEVFYGHILFEALTEAFCPVEQHAEVDLVLPPGVSIAPDAAHPIRCNYSEDNGETEHPNPTCPTHAVNGTYGPMLPPEDGGGAWSLPVGTIFEVQVPLVSTRSLDVTGGTCQSTTADLVSRSSDCLVGAVHIIDGQTDPWLVPSQQLFVAPAPAAPPPPSPKPPSPAAPNPPRPAPPAGIAVAKKVAVVKGGRARIKLKCTAVGACNGVAKLLLPSKKRRARAARPGSWTVVGSSAFAIPAGRTRTIAVRLKGSAKAALRRSRRHRVRVRLSGKGLRSRSLLLVAKR
jgi:hypothetical protein